MVTSLRRARKSYRRFQLKRRNRGGVDRHVEKEELREGLLALGVQRGQDLLVHTSLSQLGHVEGGAGEVIDALLSSVGPDATLLMPAYGIAGTMLEGMRDPQAFCVATDPSTMGRVSEVFRQLPDSRRSWHPTHSVCAFGPRAELYTGSHHLVGTPCGPGSPFHILAERRGAILCLGSGIARVTSHHVIEDMADDYPIEVYLGKTYSKEVVVPKGERIRVTSRVHDPSLIPRRLENQSGKEEEIYQALLEAQCLKEGEIGRGLAHLIDAQGLNLVHRDLVSRGQTIYV